MIDLSDPISRQQAITALRALSDEDGYISAPHEVVTDVVRGLPPVRAEHEQTTQPEQGDSDKFGAKTSETCEDCISRQAAINALHMHLMYRLGTDSNKKRLDEWINNLPSAQPELIRCKDCKHLQKWRSEESAKKFGQIYECARNVLNCPKPEDFCSRAERREDE